MVSDGVHGRSCADIFYHLLTDVSVIVHGDDSTLRKVQREDARMV